MSEAQLLGIVDYVGKCSDWFLISVFHIIEWGIRMRAPAAAVYGMVDNATFGCAQYLVLLIVLFVAWYRQARVVLGDSGVWPGEGWLRAAHPQWIDSGHQGLYHQAQPEPSAREETPFVEL